MASEPAAGITYAQLVTPVEPVARGARLYVRLRPEDHVLLRERAAARGMAAATYASIVLRAHLLEGLPDHVKGLMLANVKSWESENAEMTC